VCANTETEKAETEYLRSKTEPNRTEIEKSKLAQPYHTQQLTITNDNLMMANIWKEPSDEENFRRVVVCS